jgi:hypothetical protein
VAGGEAVAAENHDGRRGRSDRSAYGISLFILLHILC